MLSARQVRALLLVVLGVCLLLNGVWLFPQEGKQRYTYDRAAVTVENGTLEYDGTTNRETGEFNDLAGVACDTPATRSRGRVCAFDRHLRRHGPVTLNGTYIHSAETEFVKLGDRYFNRSVDWHDGNTTYDVEPIPPRDLLATVAENVSGYSSAEAADFGIQDRVAVTGEPASTTEKPDADRVGQVYRRNGTYYTVVVTDESVIDWPVLGPWVRDLVWFVGVVLFLTGCVVGGSDAVVSLVRRLPPND